MGRGVEFTRKVCKILKGSKTRLAEKEAAGPTH